MPHRHVGSGVWGIWDGGVMSWRATDLAEDDARQQAADFNVTFNQYGQRDQADRREVRPPIEVESATWSAAGDIDYWVLSFVVSVSETYRRGSEDRRLDCFRSPPRSASLARIGGEKLLLSDRPTGSFDPLVSEGVECRNSHAVMTRIRGRGRSRSVSSW
jgi:hypothetical protein